MAFSTSLKASALASIAAMGAFALATGSPALADHHGKKAEMSQANIVETAMGTGMHETLVAAVKAAGLVDTLAAPGPYTVFAPTDDAFAALPAGTVDTLLQPENKGQLTSILTYHAV
ncbi:MAG: fasciclin domain-containing protein, partial [Qipengyuania citrea]